MCQIMNIDVIIPTYRPDESLFLLLDSLENQTMVPTRIVMMNTEEHYLQELLERNKVNLQEKYPNVKVYNVKKEEFDHGATRRRAVRHSYSPIFVMMTQDAFLKDERLLEKLTESMRQEMEWEEKGQSIRAGRRIAVAYGRQLAGEDSGVLEQFSRRYNYPAETMTKSKADLASLGIKTFFCSDVCAAYRRDIYDKLGGFVQKTIFNEDMIFAHAAIVAGYEIRYEASARVVHSHNYTNLQQLRRNFDLGVSQAQHPEVFAGVKSETEGKRMVKEATSYLLKEKKFLTIPHFYMQCACKYTGYLLGKKYDTLSKGMILKLTSNEMYWK